MNDTAVKNLPCTQQLGFTLIETVLYMSLFVIIISSVLLASYSMIESTDKAQYRSLIHNEGQFAIRKLHWLLNGATDVTVSSGDTLNITNPSLSESTIVLHRNGTKLELALDGNSFDLTGDIAPVTELSFPEINPNTPPTIITMQFRMSNRYYDETFTTTKLLR